MSDDISTAVGITVVLFASLSLVLGPSRQTETRSSIWLKAAEAAGRIGMLGFGLLILLKGTADYEAPALQWGLLTVLAVAGMAGMVLERRARSDDKHK